MVNRSVYFSTKQVGKAPKSMCGLCPSILQGVPAIRPKVLMRLSKTETHTTMSIRDRIKPALPEGKVVVPVLKVQGQSQKVEKIGSLLSYKTLVPLKRKCYSIEVKKDSFKMEIHPSSSSSNFFSAECFSRWLLL
ncbi:60S ribosomal protein L34 [Lemmus lemmus]